MKIPDELRYTKDHEWARLEGDVITVGITDHAQAELTDIVFVEFPEVGASFSEGDPVLVLESVKAASDIFAPLAGEVVAVNDVLDGEPGTINTDPYGEGWIYQMKIEDTSALEALMDASAYGEFCHE